MNANIAALLYLVSGALFILALRGLASPETARIGNRRGMIGMGRAILTTLAVTGVSDAWTQAFVLSGFIGGGVPGAGPRPGGPSSVLLHSAGVAASPR